ncbi:MAG: cysteine desulfurase family protein [Aggregatilineales bacterium]
MLSNRLVYLDHAATTPTDPCVVETMLPYFSDVYGNPSSSHRFGRQADKAVQIARRTIADLLRCDPRELVFTGCGSESDNLALRGVALAALARSERPHIITSPVEHHAVSHTARQLAETLPVDLTMLPVDHYGVVTVNALRDALDSMTTPQPTLVSVMLGNNEVGTVQAVAQLAALTHERGALFHTDAVQAAGQIRFDVPTLNADLLALAGHKFYGPKGVGVLYVREGVELLPSQTGGGQEWDRRAGTHNVPLIVGLAKAMELAYAEFDERVAEYRRLRDRIIDGILAHVPNAHLTGHPSERLPNHASFVIEGVEGNALLMHLDMHGIAASTGSACNTGNPEPSETLMAMGCSSTLALGSLRLTVGKQTTDSDVDYLLETLPGCIEKLRAVQHIQTV